MQITTNTVKGTLAALAMFVVGLFLLVIRIMIPIQHIQEETRRLCVSNINNSNVTYKIYQYYF